MFKRKDLEALNYKNLEQLAQALNMGGYSIPIQKNKEILIDNILTAFVVELDEGEQRLSANVRRIRDREMKKEI